MKPFLRISRGLLRYPLALACSILCSLAVALLWGGNIGAVYPLLEVCLRGQSVQGWIEQDIHDAQSKKAAVIAELHDDAQPVTSAQRRSMLATLESLDTSIERRRIIAPYAAQLPTDPFRTVALFVGFLLVVTGIKNLFVVGNLTATSWAAQRATVDLQNRYMQQVLAIDLDAYDRMGASQLVTHFTESIEHVSRAIYVMLGASIREPLKIVSCVIGASWISWRLMVLTLLIAPPTALLISTLSRKIRRALKEQVSDSVHLNRVVFQSVIMLPTVQAYGMEDVVHREVDAAGVERMRRGIKTAFWIALTKPVTEIGGIVAVGMALIGGSYLVLNQETHLFGIQMTNQPLSIGAMLIFFGMMIGMSDPARKLADIYSNLQIGIAAAEKVDEILEQTSALKIDPNHDGVNGEMNARGSIEMQSVQFAYKAGSPVLVDVDLQIAAGETVCFVGQNGCGKSTIAKLLLRFYDPTGGYLRISGRDLRGQDPRQVRSQIALVAQSPRLLEASILENICFGSPNASRDQAIAAARLARADEFIDRLDQGYEHQVGFDGSRLSGGQKQRIALARALLRDPDVLILDEATSQIDRHSEQLIYEALREFGSTRTCILISHRPEAFQLCDRIIVMDKGQIVDQGDPATLLQTCPEFQTLFAEARGNPPQRTAA